MPEYADVYYDRGIDYFDLGQFQRSIEDFNEVIRLNPEYAKAYANRARAYTMLYMDTEAEQDINQALELGFDRTVLDQEIERLKRLR